LGDATPIQGRVIYSYRPLFVRRVLVARRVPLPFFCLSRLAAPWTGSAFVWGMNFAARTVSALEKTLGRLRLAAWKSPTPARADAQEATESPQTHEARETPESTCLGVA
jgi:hypothetical protein